MSTLRGASIASSAYASTSRSIAGPSRLPLLISTRPYADTPKQSLPPQSKANPKSTSSRAKAKPPKAKAEPASPEGGVDSSHFWYTRRARAAARPRKPLGTKPISRDILSRLVSLHHASAAFMHRPSEIMTGFDNAFKNIEAEPYFMPYRRWKKGVVSHIIEGSTVRERPIKEDLTPLGKELEDRETLEPSYLYWKTFKKVDNSWTQNKREMKGLAKSEREKQVKEALFGVWDRGGTGMEAVRPSLDGMEEWLKAKGVDMEDFAREWRERHGSGSHN